MGKKRKIKTRNTNVINMKAAVKSLTQKKNDAWKEEFTRQVEGVMDKLTKEECNVFIHAVFNAVCVDVAKGLNGEDENTVFFKAIDELYQKLDREQHKCYFNSEMYDGNETPWDPDKVPLCLMCAKKAVNMIGYYGGKPGRIIGRT